MVSMNQIDRLLREMSLAEKLGQLTMTAAGFTVTGPVIAGDSTEAIKAGTIGSLLNLTGADHVHAMQRLAVEQTRLGIPLLFALDVVHGYRTLFPIPLAEAGVLDADIWALTARESAQEAAAQGLAMTFAPMLDVARDPRWGRIAEGPGEDGWLAARIATAKVQGFQGGDLGSPQALAAVAKHFCAYGAVTAGRDYAAVDISERTLREVYLPPFAAAVAAGVSAVMPAFTDLAGVPMTANGAMLEGWLRQRLGFTGVIVSDYNAIAELVRHGIAADLADAAALALKAGVDIDMMAGAYRHGLPIALDRGHVTPKDIDAAVRRVLLLKQQLGLFDDPYRRGATAQSEAQGSARRRLAREVAARSLVLLKNERSTLPLGGHLKRVAVLGPLADAPAEMRGPWWGANATGEDHVSVLAGLRGAFEGTEILHAAGVDFEGGRTDGIAAALELCAIADAIVLCVGETVLMSGEAASRAHLELPGEQRRFAEAVFERAAAAGRPVIVILFSGRPLAVPWLVEKADALIAAWFLGSEAGNALGDVLRGRQGPRGRTVVSWPRDVGQIPVFFGQRQGGRPPDPLDRYTSKYLDVSNDPLFPFGHGLSYGEMKLSNLRMDRKELRESDTLEVRVEVANVGAYAAEETVFLFIHDVVASVSRPLLELKSFGKIQLEPGQSGTVTLRVAGADLRFLGLHLEPVFEPGEVRILVGPSADRARLLSATIRLTD
jgi:beta-glucosidase